MTIRATWYGNPRCDYIVADRKGQIKWLCGRPALHKGQHRKEPIRPWEAPYAG